MLRVAKFLYTSLQRKWDFKTVFKTHEEGTAREIRKRKDEEKEDAKEAKEGREEAREKGKGREIAATPTRKKNVRKTRK